MTLFCSMRCALGKPVSFLISMASTFTIFFASFAFMVATVNSSSGSWSCLVVHDLKRPHVTVKAIGYIFPENEVLGSFDIEKTYKN